MFSITLYDITHDQCKVGFPFALVLILVAVCVYMIISALYSMDCLTRIIYARIQLKLPFKVDSNIFVQFLLFEVALGTFIL